MKHFLYKITLYILFIGLPVCIVEFFYRQIPNDFSVKKEYLENHASEIEILNLGSSLELQAINPSFFHRKAFNAALSAQPLEYDYFILEKYWDYLNSLEVLILPLSYFTLNYKQHQSRAWMFEYHSIFGFTPDYFKLNNYFAVTSINPLTLLKRLHQYFCQKQNSMITVDSLGWRKESDSFASLCDEDKYLNVRAYANDNIEKSMQPFKLYNSMLLDTILSDCNQRGVFVILLSAPKTMMYTEYVDSIQIQETCETGNQLAKQYSNVTYVNLFYDNRFSDIEFSDANHLNAIGATKLTLILDSIIENQILIQQ